MHVARTAPRRLLAALLLLAMAAPLAGSLVGCQTNPATGERYLLLYSRDEMSQLGAQTAPQFTSEYGGEVRDPQLTEYVQRVGQKLSKQTEADYPQIDWEFTFLNSDVINAFALPGGKVFITRGLAERMTNEAQLAGVIGHEIGHVTAQHANRRITKEYGVSALLTGAQAAIGMTGAGSVTRQVGEVGIPALQFGSQLVLLSYGRDEEVEADRLGMRYMTRAGYSPIGQRQVMEILARAAGEGRQPEFLSTHPHPESRIEKIDELLATTFEPDVADPSKRLYEDRFRRDFLNRLAAASPGDLGPELDAAALAALRQRLGVIECICHGFDPAPRAVEVTAEDAPDGRSRWMGSFAAVRAR